MKVFRVVLLSGKWLSCCILSSSQIGKNPIGDGGVETLLNVIKAHRTIKFLSLEDITVSPKIFDEIKEIEKEKGVTIITGGIGGYKRPKVC